MEYFTYGPCGIVVEAYETIQEALEDAYNADDKEAMPDDEISLIVAQTGDKNVFFISQTLGNGLDCFVKDLENWEDWYGTPGEAWTSEDYL